MNRDMTLFAATPRMPHNMAAASFELYAPALYKYAFRFYQSAMIANRIVGDIFARFLEQAAIGGCSSINLRLELYAIAYDILVKEIRYSRPLMPVATKFSQHAGSTAIDIEDQELLTNIRHALVHDLTDDQRHVVMLRLMEGFSLKETALITGKKVGTVKVIQNRGIVALRRVLNDTAVETQTIARFVRQLS